MEATKWGLTVFGKGGKLKNWMLEQPLNNKGAQASSIIIIIIIIIFTKLRELLPDI